MCARSSTMMLSSPTVLLLCLFTWPAETTVIFQEPGKSIILECSSEGCPQSVDGYSGLYLLHELKMTEEVLFVSTTPSQQIVARPRYKGRIERNESTFTFTISNLTESDFGIYTCVYKKSVNHGVKCSVYAVFLTEKTPSSSPAPTTAPTSETSPSWMVYIIFSSIIGLLMIWIFFLLVIPRVKQWCSKRRSDRRVSNEYVYEDMRKNLPPSVAPAQQSV